MIFVESEGSVDVVYGKGSKLLVLFFVIYFWISEDGCRFFVRLEDVIFIGMSYVYVVFKEDLLKFWDVLVLNDILYL